MEKGTIQLSLIIAVIASAVIFGTGGYLISASLNNNPAPEVVENTEAEQLVAGISEEIETEDSVDVPAEDKKEPAIIDRCANIEGAQSSVPENMTVSDNKCFAKVVVVVEKTVQIPSPIQTAPPAKPADKKPETPPAEEIQIEVSIISAKSFGQIAGANQSPLTIGYKFTNKSDSDASLDELIFTTETYSERDDSSESYWHYLKKNQTKYTVSEKSGEKNNPAYIIDKNEIQHALPNSITIPANSSKTMYFNIWDFTGDVQYRSSPKKGTIITLEKINFVQDNIEIDYLDNTKTDIRHIP